MFRLLVADDQVPEKNLTSEQEILEHYSKLYSDPGFAAGFVFLNKVIKRLKAKNYEVDSANDPSKVAELIKSKTYNVIILDLGWWTAQNLPYDDKMVLGWRIAEEIRRNSQAQVLLFSNRFYEDDDLAKTTAEMGCLPVYKSYDEECIKHLLVTIRWATLQKPFGQVVSDETKAHSFNMYRRLSNVLLGSIVASVILLLFAVVLATTQKTSSASVISSVFGTVSIFVNGAIYKYVAEYRKSCQ